MRGIWAGWQGGCFGDAKDVGLKADNLKGVRSMKSNAQMELTTLDRELLDGLQVLTDEEISRVQAHLAAGLPMQTMWGWKNGHEPACFGCIVGTATTRRKYDGLKTGNRLRLLANDTFPQWAMETEGWLIGYAMTYNGQPLSKSTLTRLSALLDMEWNRRHPVTPEDKPALINRAQEYKPELIQEAVSVG